jgi:hypothetical protein
MRGEPAQELGTICTPVGRSSPAQGWAAEQLESIHTRQVPAVQHRVGQLLCWLLCDSLESDLCMTLYYLLHTEQQKPSCVKRSSTADLDADPNGIACACFCCSYEAPEYKEYSKEYKPSTPAYKPSSPAYDEYEPSTYTPSAPSPAYPKY